MATTKLRAPDGSEIYVQYDESDSDEFYAVSTGDIVERTKKFQDSLQQIVEGYAQLVLEKVQLKIVRTFGTLVV